jgi:hypothetical protein
MSGEAEHALVRLEALAKLMDGAFVVPGTTIRVGLDSIVGLIPGIGDAISGIISSYLIWEAKRLGVSRWIIARMAANTLLDTAVGAIPLAGDVFDVAFRGNMRNMRLLRKHLEKAGHIPFGGKVIETDYVRMS